MTEILNPQVHATGLIDVFAIGVSKQLTERAAAPFVGNGTLTSALVKGILGGIAYGKAGRIGNIVASGLVIDAAEDAAVSLLAKIDSGNGNTQKDEFGG